MIRVFQTSVSSATTSPSIRPDGKANDVHLIVSGTGTYKVQYSPDDLTWYDSSTLTGITSNTYEQILCPMPYVRLVCTAYTNGSGTVKVCSVQ